MQSWSLRIIYKLKHDSPLLCEIGLLRVNPLTTYNDHSLYFTLDTDQASPGRLPGFKKWIQHVHFYTDNSSKF